MCLYCDTNRVRHAVYTGIIARHSHGRRRADSIHGEQTRQTVPHVVHAVDFLPVLHIHRNDRGLLDGFETADLDADPRTVPRQHVRSVVGHNAHRMDTPVGNIPYEVSTIMII